MKKLFALLAIAIVISGCADNTGGVLMSDVVAEGNKISVDYTGTLEDGTVFDTSVEEKAKEAGKFTEGRDYKPLEFTVGAGQMIKGFDAAVVGMKTGETKKVTLSPEEAYGNPKPELIQEVPLEQLKTSGIEPKEGMVLFANGRPARITKVGNSTVTVDMNHELAGKTLLFEITVMTISNN